MLSETHLGVFSLACAALGLAILIFLNSALEPREVSVAEISKELVGERVKVRARVTWGLERDNFVVFTLGERAKIKAIKFNPTKIERNLVRERSFVWVVGKVELYRNELEIVADGIRRA